MHNPWLNYSSNVTPGNHAYKDKTITGYRLYIDLLVATGVHKNAVNNNS